MEFLQPLALFGLAGAAVPALLHLFQRRQPPTLPFPAVRYLMEAERRDSRRLRLRNLLLLALRTVLIAALALAASRPVVPASFGAVHAPTAVTVVLDNSASSGVMVEGRARFEALREVARAVGRGATASDRLWRITADGIPERLTPAEWEAALDALAPVPARLDVGLAVRTAGTLLGAEDLPAAVVVLSDLQGSALTPASVDVPVVTLAPVRLPPNRGVAGAQVTPETWSPGGTIVVEVGGRDAPPAEVDLAVDGVTVARGLAGPGGSVALGVDRIGPGWHVATIALAPDELRADDAFHAAVRGGVPAAATAVGAGEFVDAALATLVAAGRLRVGRGVVLGDRPDRGATIVLPPADPALVPAANQALAARGIGVRFGPPRSGEWAAASDLLPIEAVTVRRRHPLEGEGVTLATAGGEPWLVLAGDAVIVGSRLEDSWTDLPLRPVFIPFLDALVNRVGAGESWQVRATPGAVVRLPGSGARLLLPGGAVPPGADGRIDAPRDPGTYFVASPAGDTVGALLVNVDPRESDLAVASHAMVRDRLSGATIVEETDALVRAAFAVRRAEITTVLLWLALILAVVELVLATVGGFSRRRAA
jgi:Aerotolerance regulator N-terminal